MQRGVSAQKEEVHEATKDLGKGLYPHAFCKIFPDTIAKDDQWVNVMHADGAGTKSILAYLYWKETGDISVWKGIAQDAIVMNLDDLLCTGIYTDLLFSSTIDRNKRLIPGEVLSAVINGTQEFFNRMSAFGVRIDFLGGETADVGDVVRTIAVNGTMVARWPKQKLVTNEKIAAGDVIVGLAGYGQCNYEASYNSGIASNGLTSARHDLLAATYADRFPETFDPGLSRKLAYIGPYSLTDEVEENGMALQVGKLLLSPTRTFAPVIRELLASCFEHIHGMVHCSGGGQTKCMKYLPRPFHIIKDNLFEPPVIFRLIRQASGASDNEMYQVFNMGTRMEIYTTESTASTIVDTARRFGVDARIIGRVEASDAARLSISTPRETLSY